MKTKYTLILLSLFCVGVTFAQNKLFDKFAEMEQVQSVYISKAMFQMMPNIQTAGLNLVNLKGKIESLQILNTENADQAALMQKEFSTLINKRHEELMRVRSGKTNATFYILQKGNLVNEMVMLAHTENGFSVIQLLGNFTLQDIQDIAEAVNKK